MLKLLHYNLLIYVLRLLMQIYVCIIITITVLNLLYTVINDNREIINAMNLFTNEQVTIRISSIWSIDLRKISGDYLYLSIACLRHSTPAARIIFHLFNSSDKIALSFTLSSSILIGSVTLTYNIYLFQQNLLLLAIANIVYIRNYFF